LLQLPVISSRSPVSQFLKHRLLNPPIGLTSRIFGRFCISTVHLFFVLVSSLHVFHFNVVAARPIVDALLSMMMMMMMCYNLTCT